MDILKQIQEEFKLNKDQVTNTVTLIDEGNTIPFIARYRKELTGSLDDQVLRELYERLIYLRNLCEKRNQVIESITEQGKITDEIIKALNNSTTLTEIDDIYRPFRPKRRTRATIAKEKGLEPLANIIFEQSVQMEISEIAKEYIDESKEVLTVEDAINGARDIIAEIISDDASNRTFIRKDNMEKGIIESKATDKKTESVYEMYYDFDESVKKIAGHRVLAINRGEKEKILNVKITSPVDEIIQKLNNKIRKNNKFTEDIIKEAIDDSYKRLIAPSIEREIRNQLSETSEEGAIKVFSENLKQLLLQAPIKDRVVLALDPGFRTGCKVACIDGIGKVLHTDVVYCTPPQSKIEESKQKLKPVIEKYGVNIIAIGNGTAGRETESFVADMLKEIDREIYYIIVNEAGASVYSASKLAAKEFPDFDVSLRSGSFDSETTTRPTSRASKDRPKEYRRRSVPTRYEPKKTRRVTIRCS